MLNIQHSLPGYLVDIRVLTLIFFQINLFCYLLLTPWGGGVKSNIIKYGYFISLSWTMKINQSVSGLGFKVMLYFKLSSTISDVETLKRMLVCF